MKYPSLKALKIAYETGKLDRKKHILSVDNDSVTLYVGEDADEAAYEFDGQPGLLLIEALRLLGISAESV